MWRPFDTTTLQKKAARWDRRRLAHTLAGRNLLVSLENHLSLETKGAQMNQSAMSPANQWPWRYSQMMLPDGLLRSA